MAIIAFVGLPGSGKSYGVVENVILKAFADKRHVVTNIPLNKADVFSAFPDAELTVIKDIEAELGQSVVVDSFGEKVASAPGFAKLPPGAVIVLDEVWRIWPSGMKADRIAPEAKAFLAEHRHQVGPDGHTTEIVLVVQDLSNIAAFATRLVEKTYISRKHSELGMAGRYVVTIYSGAVKGLQGPRARELGVIQGKYRPEVFRFYKSHTKAAAGVVGNEQASDVRGVVWKRPLVMFGLPLALAGLVFGFFGIKGYFLGMGKADEPEPVAVSRPSPAPVVTRHHSVPQPVQRAPVPESRPAPVPAPAVPGPVYSPTWRLAGVIVAEDGSGVAMARSNTAYRRIGLEDCWELRASEWACEVDGHTVTTWSGGGGSGSLSEQLVAGPSRALGYTE